MFKGKLPKFTSNKVVGAMKIKRVVREMDKSATMKLEKGKKFKVPAHVMLAHSPKAGMYYVQYENGHVGFQGAELFESGYAPAEKSKIAPKTEAPKTEAPKTEAPKTEAPKGDPENKNLNPEGQDTEKENKDSNDEKPPIEK